MNWILFSSSFFLKLQKHGVISMNPLSVISIQIDSGLRLFAWIAERILFAILPRIICIYDTLIFTLKSAIYCCISRHIFAASFNTNSPTGMMSLLFSSKGINSTGEIISSPSSECMKNRKSASAPIIRSALSKIG